MEPEVPTTEGGKTNLLLIVAIVVVVLICVCLVLIPVILLLLGPAVGNVFSNIIMEMGTPTP